MQAVGIQTLKHMLDQKQHEGTKILVHSGPKSQKLFFFQNTVLWDRACSEIYSDF